MFPLSLSQAEAGYVLTVNWGSLSLKNPGLGQLQWRLWVALGPALHWKLRCGRTWPSAWRRRRALAARCKLSHAALAVHAVTIWHVLYFARRILQFARRLQRAIGCESESPCVHSVGTSLLGILYS